MSDQALLQKMEDEGWEVRTFPAQADQTGCCGDVVWVVVSLYMASPNERIVAFGSSPKDALQNAIAEPLDLSADKCQTM